MNPDGYTVPPLTARLRQAARTRGAVAVGSAVGRWGAQALIGWPRTISGSPGQFDFQGQRYPYLYHRYKRSWLTERTVEVPIVQGLVQGQASGRVLEVGNVLPHYGRPSHLVLDKYEQAPGVLNRDVLELDGLGPFDLIVAVSTLEHVGWDERPREPAKALQAVHALRAKLAPGGRLVFTVPIGYNPSFDAALRAGELELSGAAALHRIGAGISWSEIEPADVWSAWYDFLLYRANGVLLAFVQR